MTVNFQDSAVSQKIRDQAWRLAATKHNGALYPGTDLPYLTHIGAVTLALQIGLSDSPWADQDLAILCAILHDVIEDTPTPASELAQMFGETVANGVLALSKNPELKGLEAMTDSLWRIRLSPREVWLVKLADRLANMTNKPSHWTAEKCHRYAQEAELIIASLGEASPTLANLLSHQIQVWLSF
ncbi:MAG: HD domain-containing protein [Deltaproteobacteria bacterium]|nr:HD domain-containing protein [Deltaproteobacteria bacterium]